MPRVSVELTAPEVARLQAPGLHFVGGTAGLALKVTPPGPHAPGPYGARCWVMRVAVNGKRREMGLGGYPRITLADARRKARELRVQIDKGADPVGERQAVRRTRVAQAVAAMTFKQCAAAYISAHRAGWKNAKHAQQWENTLDAYAYPIVGPMSVNDVTLAHVMRILEPLWTTKNETAARLRGRLELVLDWATVRGYRTGDNPARWRGHLDKLLPAPAKVAGRSHHRALPIDEAPRFIKRLRAVDGMGARALEFVILTATRSGEVRGARWPEIDLDAALWTVPAARMKAGKEHRVPLCADAVTLLKRVEAMPRVGESDLVFAAPRGGQLSDMTLTAVTRRMGADAVPHWFRSTFRDWAAERTHYPHELAEMALAHAIGDKVEAAYRRGDMFEKRRQIMADWAAFLAAPEAKS